MVISTPTYHIVANIVPPEAGGPLQIGTIIDSLQELIPLNEGEEIKLPHERFFCFHEESFEATRGQITNGSGGIGAKLVAWQIPVGAEVSGEGETSADDTFNAKSLDTSFVYPTKADYTEAVKSTQLQEYLQTANYPPVYIITGMKIAREPSMTSKRGKKSGGQGQLGFNMGDRSNVGIRGDGSHARNTSQTSKKATDMVLAIRVRKLSYKKRYHIVGKRQWSDRAHDGGAELVGKERSESSSQQEPEFEVDELEMDNKDLQGSFMEEGKEADGEHITWVFLEEVHQARIKWAVSTVVPQPERCRSFES